MNVGHWSLARLLTVWAGWLAMLALAAYASGFAKLGIAIPIPSRWVNTLGVSGLLALGVVLLLSPVITLTAVWLTAGRHH